MPSGWVLSCELSTRPSASVTSSWDLGLSPAAACPAVKEGLRQHERQQDGEVLIQLEKGEDGKKREGKARPCSWLIHLDAIPML